MLKKTLAWLLATVLAIGLSGCFDGDGNKKKLAEITQQPANATVTAGATASFSVSAQGKGMAYQWQRGTTNIAGATSATYTTAATTGADDGASFRVVITNKKGSVTSNAATLTVNVPPAITTAPAAATVDVGATATFSVVATGTRLSYQWQRGTTNIAGATGTSYTTPVTALTDDGATFRVVVTNAAATVTSTAAVLTVVDPTPPSTFRTTPMVSDFGQGGMALKADGTVWAWGQNASGETTNDNTVTATPFQVRTASGPLTRITKISGGLSYGLALDADGHVWTWGAAAQLALQVPQTTASINRAERVYAAAGGSPLTNVADIAAGDKVAVAALDDGTVVVWGEGVAGSAGQGTTTTSAVPYPIVVPGLSGVVEVAANRNVVLARTADGRVYQWGEMRGGALVGTGGAPDSGTPTQVAGITSAVRIDTARNTSLAIMADGSARVWGVSAWDGVSGPSASNCTFNALGVTTVDRPDSTASTFSSVAALSSIELYVFGGRLYEVGDQIENPGQGVCSRRLTAVPGTVTGIIGVAKSWGTHTHVWTADGRVFGIGSNSAYNLGVGDDTAAIGYRELTGFNLLGAPPVGVDELVLDFESALPASVNPGAAFLTGVQNFAGLGPTGNQFAGNMLRSPTGNAVTITLANLPTHTSINLAFLFAAIDSLDGAGSFPGGDYLKITVDGVTIFRESFANAIASQVQTYIAPPGVELARRIELGFTASGFHTDSAYNMGADPQFQLIPHTASTLTLTFEIESLALQGLDDESWGIDNLRISLNP